MADSIACFLSFHAGLPEGHKGFRSTVYRRDPYQDRSLYSAFFKHRRHRFTASGL